MELEAMRRAGRRRGLWIAAALLVGLPSLAGSWHLWVNRDRGARPGIAGPSVFQRQEPAPGIIHLRLRGEGYALGQAQGLAMQSEIREMARFLREDLLGRGFGGGATRDWMLASAWKLDACAAPRFRDELRGMADATGVAYADLLLINAFDDLQHLSGCSSAVVEGDAAHPLLHGRNLDYAIARLARVKVVRDIEGPRGWIRCAGFPGFIGVLTGMSSRGLALSSHTSASSRKAIGEPSGMLYRRLLEECGSLEEMQAALASARRTMGNNLAVSDGRRHRAMALEFDAREVFARASEQGRLFVTNHFWTPALQAHQSQGWWGPRSGSQARVGCLSQELPAGAAAGVEELERAISQEGPGGEWRTPANRGTVQSVVMEPATGRMWLAVGRQIPVTRGGYLAFEAAWSSVHP